MATKNVAATPETEQMEIKVPIYLPRLDDSESPGKVDQTVSVEMNGQVLCIQRGETVEVPVWAYLILNESGRFPHL